MCASNASIYLHNSLHYPIHHFSILKSQFRCDTWPGKIVGVIFFSESPNSESEPILDVKIHSRPSPRWLEEKKGGPKSLIIAEVLLVRRTLAWLTGIILLVSTLLGVSFLSHVLNG